MRRPDLGKRFEFNWYNRKAAMNLNGIRLMQLGTVCCEPGYQIAPHTQWCHEISYFVSGAGRFIADGKETPIGENQVFITPLRSLHSIAVDRGAPLHFLYMGFEFDESNQDTEFTKLKTFYNRPRPSGVQGNQDLLLAFYRAVGELSNITSFSPLLLTGYVQSILIMSMRLFSSEAEERRFHPAAASSSAETLYSIIKYIDDHLTNIDGIAGLADALGYHPCYLSHHFKMKVGITLQEYIARKKVEQAVGLMKFSPLTMTQIAERMGFSTLQSFSHAFKRITGSSPSQYHKKILENTISR